MADGFIVRKGGVAVERTTAPSINFVSKTDSEIVVTFTNNDAAEAEVYYGITSTLTDTVTLAAAATSSNITFSGLDDDTAFIVSAYALVTDPTSKKIKSEIVTSTITTDEFVITFTAATGGTTAEYDDGGARYKSHTFNSSGTFTVTTVGDATDDRNKVDYLIIAGGGAGGQGSAGTNGGAGGAGGYRTTNGFSGANSSAESKVVVTAQGYTITVGLGGSANSSGNNSSALGITSTGGGRGGGSSAVATGGSGGGGTAGVLTNGASGIANQGLAGGNGVNDGSLFRGGGGGGAGGNGLAGGSNGAGGNGLANTLRDNSSETRGGGGGGGGNTGTATAGTGGGGTGGNSTSRGTPGTANTGGGGGGNHNGQVFSETGGSGIVVIRYEIAPSV